MLSVSFQEGTFPETFFANEVLHDGGLWAAVQSAINMLMPVVAIPIGIGLVALLVRQIIIFMNEAKEGIDYNWNIGGTAQYETKSDYSYKEYDLDGNYTATHSMTRKDKGLKPGKQFLEGLMWNKGMGKKMRDHDAIASGRKKYSDL